MPLPTTLYNFLESGVQGKVTSGYRVTRRPIVVNHGKRFRDIPAVVPGGAGAVAVDTSAAPESSFQISAGVAAPTLATTLVNGNVYSITATGASSVAQSDDYTHVPERHCDELHTLMEFWDSDTVGEAFTATVTTTSGSATITVADAERFTPGQGISGTGIPTGARVLRTLTHAAGVITRTSVVLTHKCTASADVEATMTGGNKVGEFLHAEWTGWAGEISTPT